MEYNTNISDISKYEDCLVLLECRILTKNEVQTKKGGRVILGIIEDNKSKCDFIVHEDNIKSFNDYILKNESDINIKGVVKKKNSSNKYIIVWSS